jgi:Gram-negative bacterial TonB protein C-terminal
MVVMRLASFAACAAVAPLIIAANQPERLQPSSPWVVDYGDESCHLIRSFGEGDSTTTFMFESDSPGDVDMLLIGKPLATTQDEVSLRFLPVEQQPQKGRFVTSKDKGEPGLLLSHVWLLPEQEVAKLEAQMRERVAHPNTRPPATDLAEQRERQNNRQEFAAKVTEVEIDTRRDRPVILETGSLGEAVKAFDKCGRDSLRDWGVDPDLQDKVVRPVWLENAGKLINPEEYPRQMLDEGQQSEVKARVLVDASGRVTKCTSLSHFKLPEFNKLVCDKITERARFAPAELADGTKVPSYDTLHINFRIAQ